MREQFIGRFFLLCGICAFTYSHAINAISRHNDPVPYSTFKGNRLAGESQEPRTIFDTVDPSKQIACMRGERFTQTINGNSRTRVVGTMPRGYFYGSLISFARNLCERNSSRQDSTLNRVLNEPPGLRKNDVLQHYQSQFRQLGVDPMDPRTDKLLLNTALALPLGMIESSGRYNEGRDRSAKNTSASTAEAGSYQVSFNSTGLRSELRTAYQELLQDYYNVPSGSGACPQSQPSSAKKSCLVGLYGEGVKLSKNESSYGSGSGLCFQRVMKACPALATDYMLALGRSNLRHNGPYIRRDVKPRAACVGVLSDVKRLVESDMPGVCSAITKMNPSDYQHALQNQGVFAENSARGSSLLNTGGSEYDEDRQEIRYQDSSGDEIPNSRVSSKDFSKSELTELKKPPRSKAIGFSGTLKDQARLMQNNGDQTRAEKLQSLSRELESLEWRYESGIKEIDKLVAENIDLDSQIKTEQQRLEKLPKESAEEAERLKTSIEQKRSKISDNESKAKELIDQSESLSLEAQEKLDAAVELMKKHEKSEEESKTEESPEDEEAKEDEKKNKEADLPKEKSEEKPSRLEDSDEEISLNPPELLSPEDLNKKPPSKNLGDEENPLQ